jgi:hypothetical protein
MRTRPPDDTPQRVRRPHGESRDRGGELPDRKAPTGGEYLDRRQLTRGGVPDRCQNGREIAVTSGRPRAARTTTDLGTRRLTRCPGPHDLTTQESAPSLFKSLPRGGTRGEARRHRRRSTSGIGSESIGIGSESRLATAARRDSRSGAVCSPGEALARPCLLCPHDGAACAGTGHRAVRGGACLPSQWARNWDDAGIGRNQQELMPG